LVIFLSPNLPVSDQMLFDFGLGQGSFDISHYKGGVQYEKV
jgi:hypothetical protein